MGLWGWLKSNFGSTANDSPKRSLPHVEGVKFLRALVRPEDSPHANGALCIDAFYFIPSNAPSDYIPPTEPLKNAIHAALPDPSAFQTDITNTMDEYSDYVVIRLTPVEPTSEVALRGIAEVINQYMDDNYTAKAMVNPDTGRAPATP